MGAGESSEPENANLYIRGVSEGRAGDFLYAQELIDLWMSSEKKVCARTYWGTWKARQTPKRTSKNWSDQLDNQRRALVCFLF